MIDSYFKKRIKMKKEIESHTAMCGCARLFFKVLIS